jgi:hypothetical protein
MKSKMTDMYRAFDVWKRSSSHMLVRYRCFEDLGTGMFCVQSADYYKEPLSDDRVLELQTQYIELLLEESPFKRSGSFATIEEAILDHIETFGAAERSHRVKRDSGIES